MNMSQEGVLPWQRNRNNKLLLKNEIGKGKQSTYNLPPINHVYGKPPKRDPEGAKEVTMTWKYHDETKDKEPPRDFLKLNRDCVKERFINAKDISKYREVHQDVKKKIKKGKIGIELDLPLEDFRYGVRNKPSTPINQVLELHYLQEHEKHLLDHYAQQKIEQKKDKKIIIKNNQSNHLRSASLEKIDKDRDLQDFKLERFRNIKPKIQTRSTQSMVQQQKNHQLQDEYHQNHSQLQQQQQQHV